MSGARDRAVAEALAWVGTPYVHQASAKGQGTDCLGLVRGVYRALHDGEPLPVPPYTPDWRAGDETLLRAARTALLAVTGEPAPGDVLLFRMDPRGPAKHCGVLIAEARFVHAYSGRAVTTAWLSRWWRARLAGAFSFPEPEAS